MTLLVEYYCNICDQIYELKPQSIYCLVCGLNTLELMEDIIWDDGLNVGVSSADTSGMMKETEQIVVQTVTLN